MPSKPPIPPRKLDDDLIEVWGEAIARGLTPRLVCGKLGLSMASWDKWRRQGLADIEAGIDSVDARLMTRHAHARAERADRWLLDLNASEDDATKRWLLERCEPEDFAPRPKVELTGADGGPVKAEVSGFVAFVPPKQSIDDWKAEHTPNDG